LALTPSVKWALERFFLFLEKKTFTPNCQFGRQEKDFIHQASNFFELVKIGENLNKSSIIHHP